MSKNKNTQNRVELKDMSNVPAAATTKRTKKDQRKTSVGYTALSIILYVITLIPLIALPLGLAIKSYELAPYYGIWCFVGVIVGGAFALIFGIVTLIVSRKKSKSDIKTQTAKIAFTFVCLTSVFALIITYVLPDIISYATQNTLYVEDMLYNYNDQVEKNAKLDRDFIMSNIVNGNLNNYNADGTIAENGDFSYQTLSSHEEDAGIITSYNNAYIQERYDAYMLYAVVDNNTGIIKQKESIEQLQTSVISHMEKNNKRKYELYQFIYTNHVLNDYDYAFYNKIERRAFTLAIVDYIYTYSGYEKVYLQEGFNNPRLKALFNKNFDSFKQDGYNTFDDPLLLYAQVNGRMTVPVIMQLILNEGWTYTQPSVDDSGNVQFNEDGNCLYTLYDKVAVDKFVEEGGTFDYVGSIVGDDGNEITMNYGINEDGWMMFENGLTKRPLNWLVLDMLGDPMALTALDVNGLAGDMIGGIITNVLDMLPQLIDSLGNFVGEELIEDVVVHATGGAKLKLGLCFDDNGMLAINLFPMNAEYGMLGFMQASWVESNNLLFAVINVVGFRNWFLIAGAVGIVLIITAGVLRECGKRTRERTDRSRFRLENASANGGNADILAELPSPPEEPKKFAGKKTKK